MQQLIDEFSEKAQKVLDLVVSDLVGIKTGRAKPSLVESVKVEAYNTQMELRELASIAAPDPAQIIVSPWDKTLLEAIEKAINSAGLNLNAVVDGDILRIKIPSLTEETRQELVKLVAKKLESARAMLRNERAETKRKIEEQKGESGVSEDDIRSAVENLQKKVDEMMKKIEEMGESKEKELLTF
jgi:ribosome recycling factor